MSEPPIYWWWLACSRGCSFEKTSPDPAGNPTWLSEVCPVPGCGSRVAVLKMTGPDERVPRK